jgi:hypothetical protein
MILLGCIYASGKYREYEKLFTQAPEKTFSIRGLSPEGLITAADPCHFHPDSATGSEWTCIWQQ